MSTTIRVSVHVSPECEVDMRVDKLQTVNGKYAALSMDNATIFLYSRDKALEIAELLEQAAQELENENEPNDKKDKIRCKECYGVPLPHASSLLFRDSTTFRKLLDNGSFFDSDNIKKKIYKSSGLLFIDRQFFFELWEKLSHQEAVISSHSFKEFLKADEKAFKIIVDTNQRVKGLKRSYYNLSYVNKVLADNNLPELL